MAENLLSTVGPVAPMGDSVEAARTARPVETPAVKFDAALTQAEAKAEVKVESKPETKAKEQSVENPKPAQTQDAFHNVRLHFRVDPKTHEVTVLMVDKASHRVICSIPPEEIGKLKEGDLVELFA